MHRRRLRMQAVFLCVTQKDGAVLRRVEAHGKNSQRHPRPARNAEHVKQRLQMGAHGGSAYSQLAGDFVVVFILEDQADDPLLLP